MATLLNLPPELRLKIYEYAISSAPDRINIDDIYGGSYTPPRSFAARSLAEVDIQLSNECTSLYWSSNIFEVYRMGPGYYQVADQIFHRWLKYIVKDSAKDVRFLKFREVSSLPSRDMIVHSEDCINEVDVDLRRRSVLISNRKHESCSCSHARVIRPRLERIIADIPKTAGQSLPTTEVLWDLYESWYMFHPIRRRLRSWDDWQQGYED